MNPRIFGATVAGLILVVGAYVETRVLVEPITQEASLIVGDSQTLARGYISTSDQNGDGVADWQEALRTTEPLRMDEMSTSTYEIPDTLTDQFAIELFQDMVKSKSYGEFGDSPEQLIDQASEGLLAKAADELYTRDDILISNDTSAEAARVYANAVAQIAIDHSIPKETENEVRILEKALRQNDPAVLTELDVILASYEGMLTAMLKTPAPANLVKEHLDLINVYYAITNGIKAMRIAFDDPLLALLRIQRYKDDANGLYYAITGLFKQAYRQGARFNPDDPTLQLVTITDE